MRAACLFLSCVLFVSVAYARLGENADQCEKRYGKPWKTQDSILVPNGKAIWYRTDIFTICTEYLPRSTNVNAIVFVKRECDEHDIPADISGSQIEALLQANSQGRKWKTIEDNYWERSDGAFATYGLVDHKGLEKMLIIHDPDAIKAEATKYQENQKEEIKGF